MNKTISKSWTLTKRLEKKWDGNYTRMLRAILNKSWRQHPTRLQLYGHLPPITKTIQARRTRHAGHCWWSKDELISDVFLWTPAYGQAKVGRPARTYIQQLCEDTGCSPEDLPEAMNDREKWRERVRDIRASGTIWWWWWWLLARYYSFYLCRGQFHQSHQLVWQKTNCSKYHCTTELMSWKNVLISTVKRRLCENGLLSTNYCWGSKTMSKGCRGSINTKTGKESGWMKFFGLTEQSSKSFGQIGESMCDEDLVKGWNPLYRTNRKA